MAATAKGIIRRQDALNAAAKLFRQRGYQGTSMDDVAAAANMTKSTLYHYYPSKAEMLAQIYHGCIDTMLTAYRNQSPNLDPRQRVRQIVLDMVDGLLKRPDYMLVYIQEMQWLETWLPQHQATHLRNREQELWAFLQRWIGEAIEREQFATHDPFVTAMTMMGAIAWMPHWLSSTSNKIESKDAAEQIANLILNGLLPR